MKPMIRTKGALYEAMLARPDMDLEWCQGTRSDGWYWLRVGNLSETLPVHASAALALVRQGLVVLKSQTWSSHRYRLTESTPERADSTA